MHQAVPELRAYMRSLVDIEATPELRSPRLHTRFAISAQVNGSYSLVEQVLRTLGEAVTVNAR